MSKLHTGDGSKNTNEAVIMEINDRGVASDTTEDLTNFPELSMRANNAWKLWLLQFEIFNDCCLKPHHFERVTSGTIDLQEFKSAPTSPPPPIPTVTSSTANTSNSNNNSSISVSNDSEKRSGVNIIEYNGWLTDKFY